MSSRRSKRQRTSGDALDMSNYMNWIASKLRHELEMSKLRHELEKVNILTSSSFGISTLRKLYVDNVLNKLNVPVSSDVCDTNELNVSHGIPENSSVVSEAFGNTCTVNTIVDTSNRHTGNNFARLPENYFQPNARSDFSVQCSTGNGDSNMAAPMLQTLDTNCGRITERR